MVIAAGGDGTVRACAEGMLDSEVPLGLIPIGTGNALARDLGIPEDVEASIDVLSRGIIHPIDVGVANGEPFVGFAGMGLAARMIRDSDTEMKSTVGPLAYLASAVRNLWKPRFRVELTLDTGEVEERRATLVLVATAGVAPGGLTPFPDSRPGDGLLRVLTVDAYGLFDSLRALGAVVAGRPHELVTRHVARACVAETRTPQPYELNGESRPETTRVRFHIRPRALRVLAPATPERGDDEDGAMRKDAES
jgi:diacylglycerol kinase family enzyme